MEPSELAEYIDHTMLKPNATKADIEKVCNEAIECSKKHILFS